MSDSSDIEIQSALPKKRAMKLPISPTVELLKKDPKKITTKEMILQALVDLKSRKGTSLHAIKKYIVEKYEVDVEKFKFLIKKNLKAYVEMGTVVQTKGVGASGSFKLAAGKEKVEKKKKKPKKDVKVSSDKPKKSKEKPVKPKIKKKDTDKKNVEKKSKKLEIAGDAQNKEDKAPSKVSKKKDKTKSVISIKTPAKKRAAMMKRKSIGSIIKPPKMKPKAKKFD